MEIKDKIKEHKDNLSRFEAAVAEYRIFRNDYERAKRGSLDKCELLIDTYVDVTITVPRGMAKPWLEEIDAFHRSNIIATSVPLQLVNITDADIDQLIS